VLPLLALPFLGLFCYEGAALFQNPANGVKQHAGLNGMVVMCFRPGFGKKEIAGKLDATGMPTKRRRWTRRKSSFGNSANAAFHESAAKQKKTLDAIDGPDNQ